MVANNQSNKIHIRSGQPEDNDVAAILLLRSADTFFTDIFGFGNKQKATAFLRHAWQYSNCKFGYGSHRVAVINDKPVGLCTCWHSSMPESFASQTSQAVVSYYNFSEAIEVVKRAQGAAKKVIEPEKNELIIGHFAVLPLFQRKGIGKVLLDDMFSIAKTQSHTLVGLDVEINNVSALYFYQAYGFKQTHLSGEENENKLIHMQKEIDH